MKCSTASSPPPIIMLNGQTINFTSPNSSKMELALLHKQASHTAARARCYLWVCTPKLCSLLCFFTPLAARVHRLTRGEQQGNPGQHRHDVASSLQKTKRSLEATDASGRP